jgi:S-formylglutathione hydrolase FrmB
VKVQTCKISKVKGAALVASLGLALTPSATASAVVAASPFAAAASGAVAASPFAACQAPDAASVVVGKVACRREPAAELGGTTAFSYFVPPGCADRRCPTLYLLHGFGGDLTSMLGTPDAPSAWVAALAHRPQVSPYATDSPWTYADQRRWKPAAPVDLVLVAPDGRTVPGGYGPGSLLDGFWADWNPKYAKAGADSRYPTRAPRFASYVVDELVPFVERHLGVARGRGSRALDGESLGGYGSYAIGLQHPDDWASIGADSGIMNILLAPGLAPAPSGPAGLLPPTQLPPVTVPAPLGGTIPLGGLPGAAQDVAVVLYAFGDPVADQAYYLARQPVDLAGNARARRGGRQSLLIRGFSNDTIPRQPSDFSLPGYLTAQAFEDLVLPTNLELNQAFAAAGVSQHYELHPGIHSDTYWNPWLRAQVAAQYARLRHRDGTGRPPPYPTTFDYLSGAASFTVWGWHVRARRPVAEMLRLTDVSCHGFTVHGTGRVTIITPPRCGKRTLTLNLGPSLPTSEIAGADALPGYGRTVRVTL